MDGRRQRSISSTKAATLSKRGCMGGLTLEFSGRRRRSAGMTCYAGACHHLPATANKAFGLVRAIVSNVRAAPLGCLRPCSQP
jgi:hypothetical protein